MNTRSSPSSTMASRTTGASQYSNRSRRRSYRQRRSPRCLRRRSGTLINEGNNEGFCLVQRLSQTLLAASGTTPTQVRIRLRGPLTGSLTLDKVTISKAATAMGSDPYDSDSDLIDVASGVTIAANAAVTVGPVNYTRDFARDLIVAFDISSTAGQGNVIFGALANADAFSNPGTVEAGVADRTPNNQNTAVYQNTAPNTLALIELIQVL